MSENRAVRRYRHAMLLLSALYAACLMIAIQLFRHGAPAGPLAYLAAILPALPVAGLFAAMGRYLVEETDEYQRMLMTRQALIASGFALTIATIFGFLQSFDLAPAIDAYWLVVLWFFGLGLGDLSNRIVGRGAA